jgi:hypothetical protein
VIERVQIVAIVVSAMLLLTVVELVRRRKLVEEYSLVWILGALGLLGLSIWRHLLDQAAALLGVFYPPSLLLMLLVVMVFVGLLWFSVVLSRQRRQIDHLIEQTAILEAEVRRSRQAARGERGA